MSTSEYAGQVAALATRHSKERVIAPVFAEILGMSIVGVEVDTDSFGTFAGDIPRTDTPFNVAIAKARAGMVMSGLSLGLASEGTIGPDPLVPLITSDIETIVFIDDTRGIVLSETTRSTDIVAFRQTIDPEDDLSDFMERLADRADFPHHALIVHSGDPRSGPIVKGLTDEAEVVIAIEACMSTAGSAVVESDLRACFSPSRMRNIGECARQLAERIATRCPDCGTAGWGRVEPLRGLPCASCGMLIESAIRADVFGCALCPTRQEVPRTDQVVEPRWCPACNP